MAKFNTNQARQLYVVTSASNASKPTSASSAGATYFGTSGDGDFYLMQMGKGGLVRSDLVPVKGATVRKVGYAAMRRTRQSVKVTLKQLPGQSSVAPIAGQDYILNFNIVNAFGGGNDDVYNKVGGMVHAITGMTELEFYQAMVENLKKNFSREANKWFDFSNDAVAASHSETNEFTATAKNAGVDGNNLKIQVLLDSTAGVNVSTVGGVTTIAVTLASTAKKLSDLKAAIAGNDTAKELVTITANGTATDATAMSAMGTAASLAGGDNGGIVITEADQPWSLGQMAEDPFVFNKDCLSMPTITYNHDEYNWADAVNQSGGNVENGKAIADLEYFCMGERGDIYRKALGREAYNTQYMVDPTKKYDVFEIHYAYQGSCEDIQKSEKDLTIVCDESLSITSTIKGYLETIFSVSL